jgi:hypothetical protein
MILELHTDVIRTRSPLLALYFTRVKGLKIDAVRITPRLTLLGAVVYSKCWVLAYV